MWTALLGAMIKHSVTKSHIKEEKSLFSLYLLLGYILQEVGRKLKQEPEGRLAYFPMKATLTRPATHS